MDDGIKDARKFWKEKELSVEKSKTAVTRSRSPRPVSPSGIVKNGDKLDEAKRRNKEELAEVLRQRRQSSSSPEPCVTSSLKRSHPGKGSTTAHDIPHDSKLRDRWKRTTVASTSRVDVTHNPTPIINRRSPSPLAMSSPYKVMCTHDSSTVATKMADRINSLKKITVKPHPPLRPASSVESTKQTSAPSISSGQQASLKKRPFSTSAVDISSSTQHSDNDKSQLQLIMDKNSVGSCDQHLLERDSIPHNVQQFRTLLDRITNKQRPCYLNSPVISQHLILAHRDRINSIVNIEDYQAMMINVVIEVNDQKQPIKMTCKVGVSVSHVIKMAWERLPRLQSVKLNELVLKVCGRDEYLDNDMLLSDYEYVHQCLKFGTDVHVTMVMLADANQTFSYESATIKEEDCFNCFRNHNVSISKEQLNKILCVFFDKADQYRSCIQSDNSKMFISIAEGLIHSVQFLCQLLSTIEPLAISEAIDGLKQTTLLLLNVTHDEKSPSPTVDPEGYITFEGWNLMDLPNSPVGSIEALQQKSLSMLDVMTNAVKEFVADYCISFNMPFIPTWPGSHDQLQDHMSTVNISTLEEPIRIKICCLHRPGLLSYHMYQVEAGLYYGGCQIGKTQISHRSRVKKKFFDSITWDVWLNFSLPLSQLPLETRVCFTIHGNESLTRKSIGWVAMPMFSTNRQLQTGEHYLCVWPSTEGANPIGTCDGNTSDPNAMILQVSFDRRGNTVLYNHVTNTRNMSRIYPSLPTEDAIKAVAQKDHFTTLTEEEQHLLWNNRYSLPHILSNHPRGLPLLLLSLPDYSHSHLADIHAILDRWKLQEPTDALELLNVQFVDIVVRDKALLWLQRLSSDDLYDLLPQLVQVVKYDWPGYYGTIVFLLQQAAVSPHIAHMLFWLTHPLLDDPYFGLQYKMLWVGLKIVCSGPIGQALDQQLLVVESLRDVAMAVKTARVDRQATLVKLLQKHSMHLNHTHYRLPLSLSMLVSGLEIEKCSFFNSNTVPLKLTFINHDPIATAIPIIFKIGDDLRQDMLTLQLIKLMEKIWLRAGLDLKVLTYRCLPTGPNQGILEMVTEAETLRSIQTSHGLTGALNEKRLAEWLMKHNSNDMAYKKATDCFIRSCAGYCVATYVLGICDRHNDNIMVKKSGHMFHIDFGRIFGNAQMFGSIKRDRAPFVLTPDMAYVINGGDTPTTSFQKFTDLCCAAYNELRKSCNLFINLLELMLTSGMPELSSSEDVQYVRDALMPGATDIEAIISFTRCIEASLGSKATQINFFIHNLAQMKFSGSTNNLSNGILSFCPTSYIFNKEERILEAVISKSLKRYYPQRYYVYLIEVTRPKSKEQVFRRYSEFHEMHTKLVCQFPDHTLPALPGKIYVGRSQVRHVSEKRRVQLNDYLQSLLKMDSIVAESNILYTFLHQMIRDETDASKMEEDLSESDPTSSLASAVPTKVKLQISYNSSDQLLSVMVRHVRNLVPASGTNTANPYVKVYLLPDPYKSTKKKTKIAKKTLHPTYNETLTYKVPQVELVSRTLYLCVWDHGSLPKQCLGAVTIDVASLNQLTTGTEDWYTLQGKPN